jgi:predicted Zn-dependent protease
VIKTRHRTLSTSARGIAAALAAVLVCSAGMGPASAQSEAAGGGISRIRDAEIEADLGQWESPVWQAAGLAPDAERVILIDDDQINAFVAGGQNIFIYTGLLTRSDSANQVVGVMAHETGHIAGGHLARMGDAIEKAEVPQIVGMIVGAAAGILTHQGGAAAAGMGAGNSMALHSFLSFSQTQERSADQAGTTFLERTDQSARGLLEFMQKLQNEEFLSAIHEEPYLMTHPLTQDRIDFMAHVVQTSKYSNVPESAQYKEQHARMVGKLAGFLWPTPRVFAKYPASDTSMEATYARSIAYHRLGDETQAQALIDQLLVAEPTDPYFNELKGQFYFESGKIAQSIPPYQAANRYLPNNPLLETEMAQVMIESGDPSYDDQASAALHDSATRDPDNGLTWRLLATVDGRRGDLSDAALDLAEEDYADGDYHKAKGEAKRAGTLFPAGSRGAIRAQDIQQASDDAIKNSR